MVRGVAIGRLKSSSVGVFTLVIAELVPIGGGADKQTNKNKNPSSCAAQYLSGGLRRQVWLLTVVCDGAMHSLMCCILKLRSVLGAERFHPR